MGARDETTTSYLHYTYSDRCLVAVGWSGLLPQRAKRRGRKSPGKRAPGKRRAQTASSVECIYNTPGAVMTAQRSQSSPANPSASLRQFVCPSRSPS